ncbi:MAG: hypothetical protein NTY88_00300 [Bacteroidetes bacterium]|nr:hypothetical protein [Bacteroidota bacterium]
MKLTKKQVYSLDDIGFVGTQKNFRPAQQKKESKEFSEALRKYKEKNGILRNKAA